MEALNTWIEARWQDTLIPLAVFIATLVVLLWLYRPLLRRVEHWLQEQEWRGRESVSQALGTAYLVWIGLVAAYLGLQASRIAPAWKLIIGRSLWTAFLLSTAFLFARGVNALLVPQLERFEFPRPVARQIAGGLSALVILVAALMVLDLWGAPVAPLLLVLAIGAVAAAIAFRDIFPSLLAFAQIQTAGSVKVGDYVRLEAGEAGYVTDVGWSATRIRALDGSQISVPNAKMLQGTVVNYGRPAKKAKEPFHFNSRLYLKELTGLKARDLRELVDVLRTVPESVVYYHTHHYLEEHQYLAPQPANDFADWVTEVLGEDVLGEKLASVDTFEFRTLSALRDRLAGIIEEELSKRANSRRATEGREFHFIKSVGFVIPTHYVASDLRELADVFRKLPVGSLYFHIFESPLRLGRETNDFIVWLSTSLGEEELAREIANLDPYNYTLEDVRWRLLQAIERRAA